LTIDNKKKRERAISSMFLARRCDKVNNKGEEPVLI